MKREFSDEKRITPANFGRQDVRVKNRISYYHSPPAKRGKTHWSIKLTAGAFFLGLAIMAIQLIAEVIR